MIGWPWNTKSDSELPTHFPSPQTLHPLTGTAGQAPEGTTGAAVGAGVIGAAVGSGVGMSAHSQTAI